MAYTQVNVVNTSIAGARTDAQGTAGSAGGAGTGLSFSNDGHVALLLEETLGGTPSVVVEGGISSIDGLSVGDKTYALVANQTLIVGPFPVETYNQPTSNLVQINFTGGGETGASVLPIRI